MSSRRKAFVAMVVVAGVVALAIMAARSQASRWEAGQDAPLGEYEM